MNAWVEVKLTGLVKVEIAVPRRSPGLAGAGRDASESDGHPRRLDSSQLQALPSLQNPGHQGISRRIV